MRKRQGQGSQDGDKRQPETIPSPEQPPSYEDTMKTGAAGGFIDPGAGAGHHVKTIVQVVQVCFFLFLIFFRMNVMSQSRSSAPMLSVSVTIKVM